MATTQESLITPEQAEYARANGYEPGADFGYRTPDLWVSASGRTRIYPAKRFGEVIWVVAHYYRGDDRVPFNSDAVSDFRAAITRNPR